MIHCQRIIYVACAFITTSIVAIAVFHFATLSLVSDLQKRYRDLESPRLIDRNGVELSLRLNGRGAYARYLSNVPPRVSELLIKSEDRWFYLHPGVNPLSIGRSLASRITGKREASSTLTQQLAKLLMETEQERTVGNKLKEGLAALALDWHVSKKDILLMYVNSAYFGQRAQGFEQASRTFFNKSASALTDSELVLLLSALPSPTAGYPGTERNNTTAQTRAKRLGIELQKSETKLTSGETAKAHFEMLDLAGPCKGTCALTTDSTLTQHIREIVQRHLQRPAFASAANGAVVVLKLPENELLAIVGSPDPSSDLQGYQLNMAAKPRPIGSTAKPFIYLKGFEKGLRPSTLVDDREYTYGIGSGFSLYPKNYDYRYRGEVTLHYALSNSLNVPTVKVLEYVGIEPFSAFLRELGFKPLQSLESYGLGIALGGLEMDLLSLSHLFSLFPNGGVLKPLRLYSSPNSTFSAPMISRQKEKRVAGEQYVQLVTKLLSDRQTGVEQFGMKSSLNLPFANYAVKTGTSRDFHDSWTVGYTPDFLVGVWVGNADNTPLKSISGQIGAGEIWHDVMALVSQTPYNRSTPLATNRVKEFSTGKGVTYGLAGDTPEGARDLLLAQDSTLIHEPHNGDRFLLEKNAQIRLRAKRPVTWSVNGETIGSGKDSFYTPLAAGKYTIHALEKNAAEEITVEIIAD